MVWLIHLDLCNFQHTFKFLDCQTIYTPHFSGLSPIICKWINYYLCFLPICVRTWLSLSPVSVIYFIPWEQEQIFFILIYFKMGIKTWLKRKTLRTILFLHSFYTPGWAPLPRSSVQYMFRSLLYQLFPYFHVYLTLTLSPSTDFKRPHFILTIVLNEALLCPWQCLENILDCRNWVGNTIV